MTTSTNLPGHPQVPNLAEVPGSILGRESAVTKVLLRRSAAARRARYSTVKIWVGAICAGVVVIPVVLAGVLPLPDPIVGALSESSLPPFSAGHLLGTDPNGRDLLSRILHGGQTSLVIGFLAIFVSGLFGIVAGAAAGYFGGWLVIAFAQWPEPARITRALVLVEREKPYVAAARVLGLPKFSILSRHVVPNILQQVLVVVLLLLAQAVLLESALSFLGAGVQRPYPTWGGIISDGRELFVTGKPWLVTVPGVAIALLVVGVNLIGDGLRDRVRRAKGDQT